MAGAQALLPRSGDWTLRPFEATRVAPVWIGIGIAFAYLLLDAVVFNLFGLAVGLHIRGVPFYETLFWWLELLNAAILAYLPTATAYLRRGAARDLRELRPLLRCNDTEFATLLRRTTCAASWQLTCAGVLGGMLFAAMVFLDPGFWIGERPSPSSALFVWTFARSALTGWLAGHALVTEIHVTWAYASIGRTLPEVDLLDIRPLRPFARKGQHSAFRWIALSILVSFYWLAPNTGRTNPFLLIVILLLVALSFVLPALGLHLRIREAKRVEIERLHREIRQQRQTTLAAPATGGGRLADLISYRDLVDRAFEWPWDTPTLLRVALYMSLGVGSWLGGALVERALAIVLG